MPLDFNKLVSVTTRTATRALAFAADAGVDELHANLAAGERSGRKYPNLPRTSSAFGEFPQEQFGDLRDSVKSWRINPLRYAMGFQNAPDYALDIEQSRAPLANTFEDPMTQAKMLHHALEGA